VRVGQHCFPTRRRSLTLLAQNREAARTIKALAERSSLRSGSSGRTSGAGGECGQLLFGEAHAFGQDDAETVEQGGLGGVGLGDAAQPDLDVGDGRQHHVVGLDARKLFEHAAGRIGLARPALPHLQSLPQHEASAGDKRAPNRRERVA